MCEIGNFAHDLPSSARDFVMQVCGIGINKIF